MESEKLLKLEQEIYKAIAACRERVFDLCEVELNQNDKWALFRRQLLKYFGNRGLEGEVARLFRIQDHKQNSGGTCA